MYDLNKDTQSDLVTAQARSHIAVQKGHVIWDPENYNRKQYNWYLDQHALSEKELLAFGELATRARKRFELDQSLVTKIDPKMINEEQLKEITRSIKLGRRQSKFEATEQPI